jgi:chromate transporter
MPFEWASLAIGAVATVAIFRFKVGVIPVIPVIAGCAVLGLVWQLAILGR